MFDVFYFDKKPGLFSHERQADNIEHAKQLSRTRYFWVVNYLIDYNNFDFLWEPVPWQAEYTHVWPTEWDQVHGAYLVPAHAEEIKYHFHDQTLASKKFKENFKTLIPCKFDFDWVPHPWDPPFIYVFGNQHWGAEKMPTVEYHSPGASERKYIRYPYAQLLPNIANWAIPDNINWGDVDTTWVPDPGDPPYRYQFATQHQKTGGPVYTVPGATETKYLAELKIRTVGKATAIVEIDHLDGAAGAIPATTKRVRYFDNYRDTLVRIAKSLVNEHEYIWVCSSICDYTDFDWSWHPEQWQATTLHVFRSNSEKFGDTFFMHVPTFAEYGDRKALLEWYDVNFVDVSVPRRPMPVIQHSYDSHAEAVRVLPFNGPLALYTTTDYVEGNLATVPLWRTETKTIVPLSKGATSVIVPKSAVADIRTQMYDYLYIDKTHRMLQDQLLDIVFISNGEHDAENLYQHLVNCVGGNLLTDRGYRIKRVQNVKGRVAAYHAAAQASTTPWFFAVFGKLEVNKAFDWTWQPDRMQQPKHYIFHALNPVNGLQYGHQAMIAYNKKLVLENAGQGLDFTLDQPHEVVPLLSGIANYYTSNWMCWRTAFREALKLRASMPDVENEYRLNQWLDVDHSAGKWSSKGAQDAVDYYEEVQGDFNALKKSYEWEWLASYAFMKRNLVPDR